MKNLVKLLASSILSGILISIGLTAYLFVLPTNKIVASLLFGFGLYATIICRLFLYTGQVGFLLDNNKRFLVDLAIGLFCNILGVIIIPFLMRLTRQKTFLYEQAKALIEVKQSDKWYSILILSIMCGVMIYLAVKLPQKTDSLVMKAIISYVAVSIFILSGFEHCIANCGYYVYAKFFNAKWYQLYVKIPS